MLYHYSNKSRNTVFRKHTRLRISATSFTSTTRSSLSRDCRDGYRQRNHPNGRARQCGQGHQRLPVAHRTLATSHLSASKVSDDWKLAPVHETRQDERPLLHRLADSKRKPLKRPTVRLGERPCQPLRMTEGSPCLNLVGAVGPWYGGETVRCHVGNSDSIARTGECEHATFLWAGDCNRISDRSARPQDSSSVGIISGPGQLTHQVG